MEDADSITLDNGIVVAAIKKTNANLLSLKVRGVEFLSKGQGYWNVYGKIPGQANTQEKTATTPMSWCVIFGGAAGIAEMLLQSQNGEIHLLPALPDSRPEGREAGQTDVGRDLVEKRGEREIRYAGRTATIRVEPNHTYRFGDRLL